MVVGENDKEKEAIVMVDTHRALWSRFSARRLRLAEAKHYLAMTIRKGNRQRGRRLSCELELDSSNVVNNAAEFGGSCCLPLYAMAMVQ